MKFARGRARSHRVGALRRILTPSSYLRLLLLVALFALVGSSVAPALVITGGPVDNLPGGGTCSTSGISSQTGGATITCSGVALGSHSNVYFGIKNTVNVNGNTMTGVAPAVSSSAVFRVSSTTSSSITYTSTTTINNLLAGSQTVSNRLILTLTSGSASVVATGGSPANNGNGDIGYLFRINSGTSFSIRVDVHSSSPSFPSFGYACPAVYDPTKTPVSGSADISMVDLAFYYSDCGDGVADSPEQCDLGAQNGASTSCCTTSCQFRSAGQTCRTSAGVCDVVETCTGASGSCPVDGFAASTVTCRAAVDECDQLDRCTGSGPSCPADAKKPNGTACTADPNPCTLDQCDGSSNACQHPAGNAGAVCRIALNECDLTETCTGLLTSCPADTVKASGTPCTDDGNVCSTDSCNGTIGAPACDHPPGNIGTTCRAVAGECDLAEACDGSIDCPADAHKAANTPCTEDGNPCTLDQCDGAGVSCTHPAGHAGTLCRTSAGECDLAEVCDGSNSACPTDARAASGTSCTEDGNPCTLDQCDGSSVLCQHPVGNAGAVCRAANGVCDVDDHCTGVDSTCPTDAKSTAVCRPIAGDCDVAENCDGLSDDCPTDAFLPTSVECRAMNGVCDVAEACTGASAACPADGFQSSIIVCRASVGNCDAVEFCPGDAGSCPPDEFVDGDNDGFGDPCDNCPGLANDQADGDGDDLGDACDPCTRSDGGFVVTSKLRARTTIGKLATPPGDDKFTFIGRLEIPGTPPDPQGSGIRIIVEDSMGVSIFDATIPGGQYTTATKVGWTLNPANTIATYRNTSTTITPIAGITKVVLRSLPINNQYVVKVFGKKGNYVVTPGRSVKVTIITDPPLAESGECGQATYPGPKPTPACVWTPSGAVLRCK